MDLWILLVNGKPSKDGYFTEEELDIAEDIKKSYSTHYDAKLVRIRPWSKPPECRPNCC